MCRIYFHPDGKEDFFPDGWEAFFSRRISNWSFEVAEMIDDLAKFLVDGQFYLKDWFRFEWLEFNLVTVM